MPAITEQILETLKMLNTSMQKLDATMAKPRPTRRSQRVKVFADYIAKCEQEEKLQCENAKRVGGQS